MKKVLFIDRDGTIITEPLDEQVDSFEELQFLPGVISSLSRIAEETDYELVMVTNQDGLGSDLFPEETLWTPHNKVLEILRGEGIEFSEIFIDRTYPEVHASTRKPGTALLSKYLASGVDLTSSFVIGDRVTDLQLAKNLGCRAIRISDEKHPDAVLSTKSWFEIYRFLKDIPRRSFVERKTMETSITAEINLDGSGKSSIDTGIGFFDHMLDQT